MKCVNIRTSSSLPKLSFDQNFSSVKLLEQKYKQLLTKNKKLKNQLMSNSLKVWLQHMAKPGLDCFKIQNKQRHQKEIQTKFSLKYNKSEHPQQKRQNLIKVNKMPAIRTLAKNQANQTSKPIQFIQCYTQELSVFCKETLHSQPKQIILQNQSIGNLSLSISNNLTIKKEYQFSIGNNQKNQQINLTDLAPLSNQIATVKKNYLQRKLSMPLAISHNIFHIRPPLKKEISTQTQGFAPDLLATIELNLKSKELQLKVLLVRLQRKANQLREIQSLIDTKKQQIHRIVFEQQYYIRVFNEQEQTIHTLIKQSNDIAQQKANQLQQLKSKSPLQIIQISKENIFYEDYIYRKLFSSLMDTLKNVFMQSLSLAFDRNNIYDRLVQCLHLLNKQTLQKKQLSGILEQVKSITNSIGSVRLNVQLRQKVNKLFQLSNSFRYQNS